MIVALTGTPGVGKSSVADILKKKHGYEVINIMEIAIKNGFTLGYDENRESYIVDVDRVAYYLRDVFRTKSREKNILLDGHLSHYMDFSDLVVVLRCRPEILRGRLLEKGWKEEKIRENVEAEALDIILSEAVEIHGVRKVCEIDTSGKGVKEVAEIVEGLINGKVDKEQYRPGKIDWSEYLVKDDGS